MQDTTQRVGASGCLGPRWAITVAALFLLAPNAVAGSLEPNSIATTQGPGVRGVLFEGAVLIQDNSRTIFSCDEGLVEATNLFAVGNGGLLAVGPRGAFRGEQSGCHWRPVSGPADRARIVGAHRPNPATDRIWMAISDAEIGDVLAITQDGGFTSELAGGLALGTGRLIGIAGHGEAMVAASLDEDEFTIWSYSETTEVFEQGTRYTVDGAGDQAASLIASDGIVSWIWAGDELIRVEGGEWSAHGSNATMGGKTGAVDAEGQLWIAAGNEGLWRFADDAWFPEMTDSTSHIQYDHGRLWLARSAAHASWPLVLSQSPNLGVWSERMVWPEAIESPQLCASTMAQLCEEQLSLFSERMGLARGRVGEPSTAESSEPDASGCASHQPLSTLLGLWMSMCLLLFRQRRRKLAASP